MINPIVWRFLSLCAKRDRRFRVVLVDVGLEMYRA